MTGRDQAGTSGRDDPGPTEGMLAVFAVAALVFCLTFGRWQFVPPGAHRPSMDN